MTPPSRQVMHKLIEVPPVHETADGAGRVVVMSTVSFTLLFAVWLMFGILGVPIQEELGLTDVQLSWISALAVLNGSMWRLPAGIITDRIGGRKVTLFLLFGSAGPAYFVARTRRHGMLLLLPFLAGLAGAASSL